MGETTRSTRVTFVLREPKTKIAFSHVARMINSSEKYFPSDNTSHFLRNSFSPIISKEVSYITSVVINSVTFPFTVLLNVLVITAVRRRTRLQSKTNILLACLAATDVSTGLVVQPSFILWKVFQLLGNYYPDSVRKIHNSSLRTISVCSSLHLMLVTWERLLAIKFTIHYPYIVTKRNIKAAVISLWIFVISCEICRHILTKAQTIFNFLVAIILVSCIIFILIVYAILYRETLRHQKKIRTQQLPQEAVDRFREESKALKTTVLVVAAVILCFLPVPLGVLALTLSEKWYDIGLYKIVYIPPFIRTFTMLNSFLNPLIYCWRQKEMRKFIFRLSPQDVAPAV